jgi:hypothetical protein
MVKVVRLAYERYLVKSLLMCLRHLLEPHVAGGMSAAYKMIYIFLQEIEDQDPRFEIGGLLNYRYVTALDIEEKLD